MPFYAIGLFIKKGSWYYLIKTKKLTCKSDELSIFFNSGRKLLSDLSFPAVLPGWN